MKQTALIQAIDADAYGWLESNAPEYLEAIESDLEAGKTPAELRRLASVHLGPDRIGLALRIEQAARHVARKRG